MNYRAPTRGTLLNTEMVACFMLFIFHNWRHSIGETIGSISSLETFYTLWCSSACTAPVQPRNYGPFITSSPPSSKPFSKPLLKKNGSVSSANHPLPSLSETAPAQSEPSILPTGLAQPQLSANFSSKTYAHLNSFLIEKIN